jgi:hypothetical protein
MDTTFPPCNCGTRAIEGPATLELAQYVHKGYNTVQFVRGAMGFRFTAKFRPAMRSTHRLCKTCQCREEIWGTVGSESTHFGPARSSYERRCRLFAIARRSSALNRSEKHRKVSFTAATMIVRDRVQRWGLQSHRMAAKGNEKRTRCRARKRRFIMASSLAAP